MKKEIFKETKSDEFRKSADIDSGNYRVFLSSLDLDRTLRIYKSLFQLSVKAVDAATGGKSTEFSSFTDKMRPLMSYIADNNLKLSSFFDECDSTTSELISKDPNIKETVRALLKNLKTIQSVRETMGAVPFNSAFLASEELTNAFIDFKLDLAWDFEHDAIIILNLTDIRPNPLFGATWSKDLSRWWNCRVRKLPRSNRFRLHLFLDKKIINL